MRRFIQSRPSPALVVAVMALIAALVGTALAEPGAQTSVSKKKTKQIAKKQANKAINQRLPIDTAELGDNAVATAKIQDAAVTTPKLANESVTTPKLAPGAVTSSHLGHVAVRNVQEALPDGGNAAGSVTCPAGEKMIGGGARILGDVSNQDYELQSSGPTGDGGEAVPPEQSALDGWRYAAHNEAGGGGDTTVVGFAVCLL